MTAHLNVCLVAALLITQTHDAAEWDNVVDEYLATIKTAQESDPEKLLQYGDRIKTLLRTHPLSHVRIFVEENGGKRKLATDIYYGKGQLHVIQHGDSELLRRWNLVTKGKEAYEWRVGSQTGEINTVETKDLVDYTIYLTDPAMFPSSVFKQYLQSPELFNPPRAVESGCTELRFKKPFHGFSSIEVDLKTFWIGAMEFTNSKTDQQSKIIFTKPTLIKKVPDEIFDRLKSVKFRQGKNSLRRHLQYL